MKVTGETDRITWEKIVSVYKETAEKNVTGIEIFPDKDYTYKKGDNGFGVSVIQAVLLELSKKYNNLKPVRITMVYDNQTENAVSNFQNQTNLPVNGKVDIRTWNMMAGAV